MGSKKREHLSETKEERKKRKREKKEAKAAKKLKQASPQASSLQNVPPKEAPKRKLSDDVRTSAGVDDSSGLLTSKKIRLRASILPSGLAHVKSSVDKCIQEFLLRYSDSVNGVIMAYNDVQIANDGRGKIVEELPHIHYDISCDALVFTPVPEAQLTGRVTGSFHSHISLVVFNYFNASISAEHLRKSGFEYDTTKEVWYDAESEYVVEKASYVNFSIEKVHEAGMLCYSFDGDAETRCEHSTSHLRFFTLSRNDIH